MADTGFVLVLNAGSSSLKFCVYLASAADAWRLEARGQIEGIGTAPRFSASAGSGEAIDDRPLDAAVADARGALDVLASWLRARYQGGRVLGVGHRVVHGGASYAAPVLVTPKILADLRTLVPLAPLHQPHNLAAIDAVEERLPGVPQVACFDTAFHRGHQDVADVIPLPIEIRRAGVQRYGFHGLSYEYIASALPQVAPEIAAGRVIVAHLGSGASLCAMIGGRSIDSSFGFTALDGLCMGTRPGALDPGVVLYLFQQLGMSAKDVEATLYKKSGLLGLSGLSNDMRDLLASSEPAARLAVDYFVYRAAKEIGALASTIRGIDGLVFTAGIGERSSEIRRRICDASAWLGLEMDAAANAHHGPRISLPRSRISVWVIPTNEELMIARHTGTAAGADPAGVLTGTGGDMATRRRIMVDGNEAAASVAYRASESIAIYPITPSSNMAELCDEWSSRRVPNLWGAVPEVAQMQSEAGAAGAVHGALQAGSLATTFTASQGLLLMIPNMYKIAGELTPFVMHVAARTLATHALSIFGDHQDVMACRQTGFALLCSNSVQEAHDMAAVAHAATLETRLPFLHFFDGFRTSHEVAKIEELTDDDLRALISEPLIYAHRQRGLTPDRPVLRGTAQNPDVFFQAREAANGFYDVCPEIVERTMRSFADLTGRRYGLFEYVGDPAAERVIVLMGSGAETVHEAVEHLTGRGEKVGVLKVRLYRPFSRAAFLAALPKTVRSLVVLDRTKEPGAPGDPLYLDITTALAEAHAEGLSPFAVPPRIIAGRYGLSSKEFTPAMVKAVFDEANKANPKRHFTVGIIDDVTHTSLTWDSAFQTEAADVTASVFYGLGSDGTVGANKNSIKIVGQETNLYAQGYFVYDSKKSGAITVSHLRTSRQPIRSAYLVNRAGFVACHQFEFVDKIDLLEHASDGAAFLLNAPFAAAEVWGRLPEELQEQIIERKLRFFAIDAYDLAKRAGMGTRINTIMQTCFFKISGLLPADEAIKYIKKAIEKTYGKRGPEVVRRNCEVVDQSLAQLHEIPVPAKVNAAYRRPPLVSERAPDFVQKVTSVILAGKGDLLPVSAFPVDGTWPVATAKWEKRNLALEIPVWDSKICIQCNQCVLVCPHAAIRAKVYDEGALPGAPETFKSTLYKGNEYKGQRFTIQVAPEDCTGCNLCVNVCPAKDRTNPKHKAIDMHPQAPLREPERANYDFFLNLPEVDRTTIPKLDHKGSQFLEPLFEYSGACAGCGETPYLKLLTQLFGDRLLIANATGCSSIYGGNLPTTPYTTNRDGRGPAWSNSLFEDNAEFGFGFRMALDGHAAAARGLVQHLAPQIGDGLVTALLDADQSNEAGIAAQRERVLALRRQLAADKTPAARRLETLADYLVKKSVWLVGGDGWAYDIGYGGLDHVLANRRDVNILVMDTEVYSNTGGQASKATPLGAAAKFAAAGKTVGKKDLGLLANMYGHVYVAKVAFGAKMVQTTQAFLEAESYKGPSLIIAYSHCIAHGYDMANGASQQKLAVDSGVWPLYRFDPRRVEKGQPPLHLDYGPPKTKVADYLRNESRFRMVERADPARYKAFVAESQAAAERRYAVYQQLAGITVPVIQPEAEAPVVAAASAPAGSKEE